MGGARGTENHTEMKTFGSTFKSSPCVYLCVQVHVTVGHFMRKVFPLAFRLSSSKANPALNFRSKRFVSWTWPFFSSSRVLALGKPESRFRLHGSSNTRAITLTGTTGWKWDLILKRLSGTITGKSWPHFRAFDFLASLLLES